MNPIEIWYDLQISPIKYQWNRKRFIGNDVLERIMNVCVLDNWPDGVTAC